MISTVLVEKEPTEKEESEYERERGKKILRKQIMDFGKYDSTETGLLNLFLN